MSQVRPKSMKGSLKIYRIVFFLLGIVFILLKSEQSHAIGWSMGPSLPEPKIQHTAPLLSDGSVLVVRQISMDVSDLLYDPASDTWFGIENINTPRWNKNNTGQTTVYRISRTQSLLK
ncbi:MAG: hypothetical protein KKI15_02800 [Proteobacteria bacterium]|nr:hypothetical protein [Pseudomonadota bacterium]